MGWSLTLCVLRGRRITYSSASFCAAFLVISAALITPPTPLPARSQQGRAPAAKAGSDPESLPAAWGGRAAPGVRRGRALLRAAAAAKQSTAPWEPRPGRRGGAAGGCDALPARPGRRPQSGFLVAG